MRSIMDALRRAFEKWLGWRRLGFIASLTVIAIAVVTLVDMLHNVDTSRVLDSIRDKSLMQIGLAALCVLFAFFTLTFYDLFALRTVGRDHVPYRIAALAAFTSYSIGHNIGATVFTGGAIRYRIYSDWGLTAIDVAKICFVSGLTFWLGNMFVLGIGMALHPAAATPIDALQPEANRFIALALLGGIVGYLIWLSRGRRELGRNGWKVTLPQWRLTLLQIAIGVVDLGFCALAMKILLPASPAIDFMSFAVAFILATLIGFASHAPGSLGVLDAALLLALPQFVREDLVATILLFRLLYFVIPFSIALTLMGSREIWINIIEPWQERRKTLGLNRSAAVAVQPVKTTRAPH